MIMQLRRWNVMSTWHEPQIARVVPHASRRLVEFFTANIRKPNAREAGFWRFRPIAQPNRPVLSLEVTGRAPVKDIAGVLIRTREPFNEPSPARELTNLPYDCDPGCAD
jgi:hypothetical protein